MDNTEGDALEHGDEGTSNKDTDSAQSRDADDNNDAHLATLNQLIADPDNMKINKDAQGQEQHEEDGEHCEDGAHGEGEEDSGDAFF